MAQSGQFDGLEAISAALRREGYEDGEMQLSGAYIRNQLWRAIERAHKANASRASLREL